jgi:hypothetical protein
MNQYLRDKTEKSEEREAEGASKAKSRHAELETRQHEDHLRHFQVRGLLFSDYLFELFHRKL